MKTNDCKRCAVMEIVSSNVSKRRKTSSTSPENSVNSAGTVVSGEFRSDRYPLSSCSSAVKSGEGEVVKELNTTPLDPEVQSKGLETVSTHLNFKSYSLLSEFCGDSEETMKRSLKMPPKEEIEEFLAVAEKYEQKRFSEKYNFDIATDMPLEGRYQWVRLN
ncbi:hypothetical protein TanjilG_23116 [Lupinus angustifolius]|uniref:Cyclin-dependent kinase inhibitor domain-containing protein n=1 Tax=Lupinus angustifolius TaxID=3871 RepID=A0A1J7FYP9_LUPAN|nr:PREDICTED: cyclin-dependent kinase inhibitor 7-like [Lupinus angustifolius]OIV93275.1 hypothetical protein TanjilG_23116 [Lupinus angustifolius]